MFRLRSIPFILVCCLTLVVPGQASVMPDGIGPKCKALQTKLVTLAETQALPEGEAAVPVCVGVQAIQPHELRISVMPHATDHTPAAPVRLIIAKRPAGIERPPRV